MKYVIILLALIALSGQGFSQQNEPYYTIKNPQTGETRIISHTHFLQEMNAFKESALENGAYYDKEGYLVIPSRKEKKEIASLQKNLSKEMQSSTHEGQNCYWREQWGDNDFGAEAYIEIANDGTRDTFHYSGTAGVKGMIFSNELKILELTSDCTADTGAGEGNSPDTNGTTKVILFGKVVYSKTNPKLEYEYKQEDLTIFKYSQLFFVGPVPVTVSAGLSGGYGFKVNASACLGAVASVIKTFGEIDFYFSAEVGFHGVIGFGVEGNLRLIYLEILGKSSIYLASFESFMIEGKVDIDFRSLDGCVDVFVELLTGKYKINIAEWEGIVTSWPLWSYKRKHSF